MPPLVQFTVKVPEPCRLPESEISAMPELFVRAEPNKLSPYISMLALGIGDPLLQTAETVMIVEVVPEEPETVGDKVIPLTTTLIESEKPIVSDVVFW